VIDGAGSAASANLVVLAIPAHAIAARLPTLAVRPGALVIDLGSTKTRICEALDRLPDEVQAVGGHPMCGLAENGYAHAIPTVYRGARFVLCETARTTPGARELAEALVRAVDAQPLWMDRAHHDRLTALSSHLPHLLSFALMRLAMEAADGDPALFELAAGGFDGATRLARTDAAMITGMFSTNADSLHEAAARLREQLKVLEGLLEDEESLQRELGAIVAARRDYTATHGERLIT
jgi:prephenate dehydrogenase